MSMAFPERPLRGRVELPVQWTVLGDGTFEFPPVLPPRPSYNADPGAKSVTLRVNQFRVSEWSDKSVWQYDVKIGSGAENRGLLKVVWNSKPVQDFLAGHAKYWLWDGNKIAWCDRPTKKMNFEKKITVNLDELKGRQPRVINGVAKPDITFVTIKCTTEIPMGVIRAYLFKGMEFDNTVLMAINFLDHCLRQWPSENFIQVKRSFFPRGTHRQVLNGLASLIEAQKGVYSSIRLCESPSTPGALSTGLGVNVDVANGTFWVPQLLSQAARNLTYERNTGLNWDQFSEGLRPVAVNGKKTSSGAQYHIMSRDFKELRKLHKLRFHVKHRGKEQNERVYQVKNFVFSPDQYGSWGGHAKAVTFEKKDPQNPNAAAKEITIYDYFEKTYNVTLQYWKLPLVQTVKGGIFPMELCTIAPDQRYMFKLDPKQTADMINFAVVPPNQRLESIRKGVDLLSWDKDPYLSHYGIKIESTPTITTAKQLQPPDIHFGKTSQKAVVKPGFAGFWTLDRSQLLQVPAKPLKNWAVFMAADRNARPIVTESRWDEFIATFKQQYMALGHKGSIPDPRKFLFNNDNIESQIDRLLAPLASTPENIPQIVLFIVPDKNSWTYDRIKKHMDCKYALVSQVMVKGHIEKNNPKYCKNVIMKLNAKLGGTTSRACKANTKEPTYFNTPGQTAKNLVMMIGADVSHPAPGSEQPSFAAVTMSLDSDCCRYAAACEVNGFNKEMIQKHVWDKKVKAMVNWWLETVGTINGQKKVPSHIYYMRDGVSEGQYLQVLNDEVKWLKDMLEAVNPQFKQTKFVVVIASKRHHIRFLPRNEDQCKDKDFNPLPGVLVEHDITHPFQYDFYLNSHKAIKGTARPVHYHVILDEVKHKPGQLQEMIYAHSYQYMRSTTPVSIHPAVYYAHLASNRARSHENVPIVDEPRGGQKAMERRQAAKLESDLRLENASEGGLTAKRSSGKSPSTQYLMVENEVIGKYWREQPQPVRFKALTQAFLYGMWYI